MAFSISFNNKRVPVYIAFHAQLDLHFWFNRTLWNEIEKNSIYLNL